jgi:hypothetical protein
MRALRISRLVLTGLLAAEGLLAILAGPGTVTHVAAQADAARQPVLVELFTSEGCSSCPPADALLARLDATQFVPGAQAIVLSEHVTYWNQDGWHDPFSMNAMTDRQEDYKSRLGLAEIYTPQAVVDGAAQMVGSDERKLAAAVHSAAGATKPPLAIQDAQWSGNGVRFSVKGAADAKTVLMAALAEDSAETAVKAGENKGRSLHHVAVVRVMQEMGKGADDGRALLLKAPAGKAGQAGQAGQAGETASMRLVVFVADRHNGHVLAVAEKTISR